MNVSLLLLSAAVTVQSAAEVRQIVTFRFQGGESGAAIQIFREEALPLYEANPPMLRFRAYREVESPEPLDLVVVSSFLGLEGMDGSNRGLAEEAAKRKTRVGDIYGRISASSAGHRDELVEMDPPLSFGDVDGAPLVVLVRLRITAGRRSDYETLLRERLVPWERETRIVKGSDSGRFLLSDGFDFFRILGLENLAAWQRYVEAARGAPFASELDGWIAESRQVILAPVRELFVR
jgi:hypothetical protein